MTKYNLSSIMHTAWRIFRKGAISFGEALRMAWANTKSYIAAKASAGVEEDTRTWSGWHSVGFEVIHESKALFKVIFLDHTTKSGTRTYCYFGASQVRSVETC